MQDRDRDRKPQQDEDDDRITASGTREDIGRPTPAGTGRQIEDEDIDEQSEPGTRKRTSPQGGDISPTTRKK